MARTAQSLEPAQRDEPSIEREQQSADGNAAWTHLLRRVDIELVLLKETDSKGVAADFLRVADHTLARSIGNTLFPCGRE